MPTRASYRSLLLRVLVVTALFAAGLPLALASGPARADSTVWGGGTQANWHPDQPGLNSATVTGDDFGQVWSAPVGGQVYAQPVISGGTMVVTTEDDNVYGVDAATGKQQWTRNVGAPYNSSDIGCADLAPHIGITGTPVVDPATGTAYFIAAAQRAGDPTKADEWMHAVDVTTGAERTGFPVLIKGTADNDPNWTFDGTYEFNRPGLLLLGGVVYAAFGSHCDRPPYTGWVVGVSAASGAITSKWIDEAGQTALPGGGIWAAGGALATDGAGQILLTTGNGDPATSPTPGTTPPKTLGQSAIRLVVQPDGSLKATDFFTPYNAADLNQTDADFGSGGMAVLPTSMGTSTHPHLAVVTGKEGYLYLLDRDNLGGFAQGTAGGDAALSRVGPVGASYGTPAAWPGNGGYVYVPTANGAPDGTGRLRAYRVGADAKGNPTLALAGSSPDAFGFGSGACTVSSNGTSTGTALVWCVWEPDASGVNGQLRAYNPVPDANGNLTQVWAAPIGAATKWLTPVIDGNKVYVGTRDGHVLAFGSPVNPAVDVDTPPTFPTVTVGQAATRTVTLTATQDVTVSGIATTTGDFTVGQASPPVGSALTSGATISVPVTFAPSKTGAEADTLIVTTTGGTVRIPLTGQGQSATGLLTPTPNAISFGGVVAGQSATAAVTLTNSGATPVTVQGTDAPATPYTVTGLPPAGSSIAPGAAVTATVTFAPTTTGVFSDAITVHTSAGDTSVALSGSGATTGHLVFSTSTITFPAAEVGTYYSPQQILTITNTGGSPVALLKSKPPIMNGFGPLTNLPEGTVVPAGSQVTQTIQFAPTQAGTATDTWFITGDDDTGPHAIPVTGVGTPARPIPDPSAGSSDWHLNGAAALTGGQLVLTPSQPGLAGTAIWPIAQDSTTLRAEFDMTMTGGGGDGMTMAFLDPAEATPGSLGNPYWGLGAGSHLVGKEVGFSTTASPIAANPTGSLVGIMSVLPAQDPTWDTTAPIGFPVHGGTHHVIVFRAGGQITVTIDGKQVLSTAVALPPRVLLGFSAATGGPADLHAISHVLITSGTTLPAPGDPGNRWQTNGSAAVQPDGSLLLTPNTANQAGSAYLATPVDPHNLDVTFDLTSDQGGGADGSAFSLLDASQSGPTALGDAGGGLGVMGTGATAVTFDTYPNPGDPGPNSVGIYTDRTPVAATVQAPTFHGATRHIEIITRGNQITVSIDGATVLTAPVTLPSLAYLGLTGGTGGLTDRHLVTHLTTVTAPSPTGAPAATGLLAAPGPGWQTNGSAAVQPDGSLLLTPNTANQVGTAWNVTPVDPTNLSASFDVTSDQGGGADGSTFALLDASQAGPTTQGAVGGAFGVLNTPAAAVTFDTYQNPDDPWPNSVGVWSGGTYLARTPQIPAFHNATRHIDVLTGNGQIRVWINGHLALTQPITLPPSVYVGFTAATGGLTDRHLISNIVLGTRSTPIGLTTTGAWQANGSTHVGPTAVTLTDQGDHEAGSLVTTQTLPTHNLDVTFDATIGPGSGADGMTLALLDPASQGPDALGDNGGGLGFSGLTGTAVTLDTYQNDGDPSDNFIGLATSQAGQGFTYTATANKVPELRLGTHHLEVLYTGGALTVIIDGKQVMHRTVALPPTVRLAFTGATGGDADTHTIKNVVATAF